MTTAPSFAVSAGAGLARRVGASLSALAGAFYRWKRRQRDLHHVMQLDDYLLRDVGLTREQVMRGLLPQFRQR